MKTAMRASRWAAWLGAVVVLACGDGSNPRHDPDPPRSPAPSERTIVTSVWDTIGQIGGGIEDTGLFMPFLLSASPDAVFLFDYGDVRAKAFTVGGKPLWVAGRRGEGPGEFVNPFDIEIAGSLVWILDEGAARITWLDPATGEYRGQVPLHSRLFRDVIPVSDRGALGLLVGPGEDFILRMDSLGNAVEAHAYPTVELRAAPVLFRQPVSATGLNSGSPVVSWAAIFPNGDDLLVYRGTDLVCRGQLMGARPIPAERTGAQPAFFAADVTMTDSSVLVLAADSSDYRLRVVDEYDGRTCAYIRSIELPVRSRAIAFSDGNLMVQYNDPAPGVLVLRESTGEPD